MHFEFLSLPLNELLKLQLLLLLELLVLLELLLLLLLLHPPHRNIELLHNNTIDRLQAQQLYLRINNAERCWQHSRAPPAM